MLPEGWSGIRQGTRACGYHDFAVSCLAPWDAGADSTNVRRARPDAVQEVNSGCRKRR
jgi:hypothetical protein